MDKDFRIEFKPDLQDSLKNTRASSYVGKIPLGAQSAQWQRVSANTNSSSQITFNAITTPELIYDSRIWITATFNVTVSVQPDLNAWRQMTYEMRAPWAIGVGDTATGNFSLLQYGTFGLCAQPIMSSCSSISLNLNGQQFDDMQFNHYTRAMIHSMYSKECLKKYEGLSALYNDEVERYYQFAPQYINNTPDFNYAPAVPTITHGNLNIFNTTGYQIGEVTGARGNRTATIYHNLGYYGEALRNTYMSHGQVQTFDGDSKNVFANLKRLPNVHSISPAVYTGGSESVAGTITQSFQVTCTELIDHPLLRGYGGSSSEYSLYNLTRLNLTLNIGELNRIFRWSFEDSNVYAPLTSNSKIVQNVTISDYPFLTLLTKQLSIPRQPVCVIPYYSRQAYQQNLSSGGVANAGFAPPPVVTTSGAGALPLSPTNFSFGQVSIGQIPDYIMIAVHRRQGTEITGTNNHGVNSTYPSWGEVFTQISSIQLTVDNQTSLLVDTPMRDLFLMSRANGVKGIEWEDWLPKYGCPVLQDVPIDCFATVADINDATALTGAYDFFNSNLTGTHTGPNFNNITVRTISGMRNNFGDNANIDRALYVPALGGKGSVLMLQMGKDIPLPFGYAPNVIKNMLLNVQVNFANLAPDSLNNVTMELILFNKNYALISNNRAAISTGEYNALDVNKAWDALVSDQLVLHDSQISGGSFFGNLASKVMKFAPIIRKAIPEVSSALQNIGNRLISADVGPSKALGEVMKDVGRTGTKVHKGLNRMGLGRGGEVDKYRLE